MAEKQERKRKGSGGRTTVLGALLAVVTLVALWLSDCIPGFGIGSSGDAEGDADQAEPAQPAEPEQVTPPEPEPEPEPPAPESAANKTLKITIDVHGCSIDGAPASDCASVCERGELFEGVDDAILDVKEASHGSVIAMTDCLKSKGIEKVAINRE
ncbi:hypothetical protein DB30_03193 [Enhygromyxa salina]|uniref:Uncharacterized protein n=1 Tax=Enhygromyxa salina TaxID=215803 RepID=A0A0C2DCP8_9BACT|nr:hypothetical protein [Enhygromyxa salina]KIG17492.1 hypothetical protein DB30_03193 [Enhygromyxa salina]